MAAFLAAWIRRLTDRFGAETDSAGLGHPRAASVVGPGNRFESLAALHLLRDAWRRKQRHHIGSVWRYSVALV